MARKQWVTVILGIAAATALWWAFLPRPIDVEIAEVTRGRFEQTVDEDGKTRVRERYTVSAPLAGKLLRIQLKAGDAVDENALLAVIVPAAPTLLDVRMERELQERVGVAQAGLARARTAIARARTALEQSEADLERTRKLAESGFVSPTQLERDELTVSLNARELEAMQFEEHAAAHQLDQARAALSRAQQGHNSGSAKLAQWEIRSPVAGRVLRVLQESEGIVALGTPLLEVGNASDLEVVVDVLTTDAVQIRKGSEAHLERYGATVPLVGRVRRVEPSGFTKISALGVEEQRVNVIIDIYSPREQWPTIGDGYRVDARIVVFSSDAAVKVPVSALFREGNDWMVFTVSGDVAHKRAVRIARRGALEAVVEAGLQPGDRVIVYPSERVADGVRVTPR